MFVANKGKNSYFKVCYPLKGKINLDNHSAYFIPNSSVHQKTSRGTWDKMQISELHLQRLNPSIWSFLRHLHFYLAPWGYLNLAVTTLEERCFKHSRHQAQ